MVPLETIGANPRQPRKSFNDNKLQELAESIEQVGILQPILVRRLRAGEKQSLVPPTGSTAGTTKAGAAVEDGKQREQLRYCLVAGERRVRAARLAGIDEIPAIICSYAETEALKIAILENIQREDLGPIEEANAYRSLLEAYGATQEELAAMLGKNRSSVANALRLLTLEPEIQTMLEAGELTRGHAKALLGLTDSQTRLRLARLCRRRGYSVRECERRVQVALHGRRPRTRRRQPHGPESREVRALRERTERLLGSPVRIERDAQTGKGTISIRFYSDDDLERLLEHMGISTDLS
jgi:ParB family chromosome partitioning protein